MSHIAYDIQWQDAMAELLEQVQVEQLPGEPGDRGPQAQSWTQYEWFQHYACLYIKYLQIYRKLEESYDQIVQPQKRRHIKQVLESTMARICQIKSELVFFNPRPKSDYVHLDDVLVDLKLNPDILEISVPKFFLEDNRDELERRTQLLNGCLLQFQGVDDPDVESKEDPFAMDFSFDVAVRLIQKNERGRQGRNRGLLVYSYRRMVMRRDEKAKRIAEGRAPPNEREFAATMIQKRWRGFTAKEIVNRLRNEELIFLGMAAPPPKAVDPLKEAENIRLLRKKYQQDNEKEYQQALIDLKDVVRTEEGPDMRERMLDDRRNWFIEYQEQTGSLPEEYDEYYKKDEKPPTAETPVEEDSKKDAKKKGGAKTPAKANAKAGKKGGKGKKDEAEEEDVMVWKGPSTLITDIQQYTDVYSTVWENRDEADNFLQKHDVELAKDVVRPSVDDEIRVTVDEMLKVELENIKATFEEKGKKGKKKKGKKKAKKKKGKKDKKKKKCCAGESLVASRSTDDLTAELVKEKVLKKVVPTRIRDFMGSFNFMGSLYQNAEFLPDPAMAQIRQLMVEYVILPLGSAFVRKNAPIVNSMLLYGPKGTGKTLLARAVATETGAHFFDLSPSNIEGKYGGKNGATMLIHMIFRIAMEQGPAVIYIDDCEKVFSGAAGKKKGSDSAGATRIKKDLIAHKKLLTDEHRVIIIGCSSSPFDGSMSELRSFFDKSVFLPYPSYSSRLMLWNDIVSECGGKFEESKLSISNLAHLSEGYTAGSIIQTVKQVLTTRRVEQLAKRPLTVSEFLNPLSRTAYTYQQDYIKFRDFTDDITGEKERKAKLKAEAEGEAEDKKNAKNSKKPGAKKK
eukprot:GILK01001116.1.p1 GENE.GILK01001116.1~~GILK01001116.1.p1  ORF type:complete len:850 (-),score=212.62 GILK01001116.1:85-2634(-)